MDSAFLIR